MASNMVNLWSKVPGPECLYFLGEAQNSGLSPEFWAKGPGTPGSGRGPEGRGPYFLTHARLQILVRLFLYRKVILV